MNARERFNSTSWIKEEGRKFNSGYVGAIVLCGALTGCSISPTFEAAIEEGVETRVGASRDVQAASKYWQCRRIPIDIWQEEYGTPERAAAWRVLCPAAGAELPVPLDLISP